MQGERGSLLELLRYRGRRGHQHQHHQVRATAVVVEEEEVVNGPSTEDGSERRVFEFEEEQQVRIVMLYGILI